MAQVRCAGLLIATAYVGDMILAASYHGLHPGLLLSATAVAMTSLGVSAFAAFFATLFSGRLTA